MDQQYPPPGQGQPGTVPGGTGPGYGPPPGYTPQPGMQPGYPPPGQPVMPQQGYPPPGQPGMPQQGYPPPGQPGMPQQGYPPPGMPPQQGYPAPAPPQGYGAMNQAYAPTMGQPQPGMQMQQPQGQQQWMARPEGLSNCPPGLEYLTQIDQILVHQQVELLEAFTSWETANKYQIKNSMGQQVYFAAEESDACSRQCCGPQRGFTMHITDNLGQEVIRVTRPFKCCAGVNCCAGMECCSMEVEVEAPVGQVVGHVKQTQSCLAPKYDIQDPQGQTILAVEGPVCICQGPCCTQDQEFKVSTVDGSQVGQISKQWSGLVKEYFTDADNFGVSFPMDLDVRMKAVMLGAVFLIDFMFFEQKQNNNNN